MAVQAAMISSKNRQYWRMGKSGRRVFGEKEIYKSSRQLLSAD